MDDGEIGRLIVQFDAKTDKFIEKANQVLSHSKRTAKGVESAFGDINVGKALDKVFDSSRLTLLQAGEERLRVFGSALEPLGALGIAAGAGLAAFGVGLEMAAKTGEWATELTHLADKLGLSTEAVQRFDYVFTASGVGVEKGREAIEHLNEVLGQAQAGLLRPQSLKAWAAIGFTPEQLRSFQTVQDLLDVLPQHFANAGSAAEQAGIAKRLGIEALIPLLKQGAGGLADLTQKTKGFTVVSAEAVEHAAALNNEIQTQKLRISEAAHAIGADMQPALVGLNKLLADSIELLERFFDQFSRAGQFSSAVSQDLNVWNQSSARAAKLRDGNPLDAFAAGASGLEAFNPAARERLAQGQDRAAQAAMARVNAAYAANAAAIAKDHADAAGPPKVDIPDKPKKPKKGPRDNGDALEGQVGEEADAAAKSYAEALAALTTDVKAHADYEKQVIADELKKQNEAIDAQEKKIEADNGITDAKIKELTMLLEGARTSDRLAAIAKAELVDRNAAEQIRKNALDVADANATAQIEALKAQQAGTKVASQRQALGLKIFDIEEQIAEAKLAELIASKSTTDSQRQIAQIQLDSLRATAPQRRQDAAAANATPMQAYIRTLQDQTGPDALQTTAVKGLEALNTGLVNAIVNSKNLGQAFSDMARVIEQQLISMAIEKYLTLPLAQALGLTGGTASGGLGGLVTAAAGFSPLALIPGFAVGTDFAPGGPAIVGEKGPELVNLPKGSTVMSNAALSGMRVDSGMASPTFAPSFDLRGAVVTQDLLDQMNQLSAAAEHRATMNGAYLGAQAARSVIPGEMSRRSTLQIR